MANSLCKHTHSTINIERGKYLRESIHELLTFYLCIRTSLKERL